MHDPVSPAYVIAREAFLAKYGKTERDIQTELITRKKYVYDENMRRHYLEEEIERV